MADKKATLKVKSALAPIVPDDIGKPDERLYAFTQDGYFDASLAKSEQIIIKPEVLKPNEYSFRPNVEPGVFYDFKNSWFEITVTPTLQDGTAFFHYNPSDWQTRRTSPGFYFRTYIAPSIFHSILRVVNLKILLNKVAVNDDISDYEYPFKDFAKICLFKPRTKVDGKAERYLNGTYADFRIYEFDSSSDNVYSDGICLPMTNTALGNGGGFSTNYMNFKWGTSNWSFAMREYLGLHYNSSTNSSTYTVRFYPNDGFWNCDSYVPATIPIQIILKLVPGSSAGYWYLGDPTYDIYYDLISEQMVNIKLCLRQVKATEKALTMYNQIFNQCKFLRFNVYHAKTVKISIANTSSNPLPSVFPGLFTGKKPQIVFIHFRYAGAIPPDPQTTHPSLVHPFANINTNTHSLPTDLAIMIQSITVSYGGLQYPRQYTYQKTQQPIGSNVAGSFCAYEEYKRQCSLTQKILPGLDVSPFFPQIEYMLGRCCFFVFNLQENGSTFFNQSLVDSLSGSLSISLQLTQPTISTVEMFVTAISNDEIVVTQNGIIQTNF